MYAPQLGIGHLSGRLVQGREDHEDLEAVSMEYEMSRAAFLHWCTAFLPLSVT